MSLRFRRRTVVLLLIVTVSSAAEQKAVAAETDALIKGDKVLRNLPYGDHERQKLDVYLPPAPKNAPIILMVHGGGWVENDKAHPTVVVNKGRHYLGQGLIYVSMNYRYAPEVTPLAQAQDVLSGLVFVQRNARKWGGNPDRIILMGHSAGGHLVSLVSSDPSAMKIKELKPWKGSVILDSAAFDVEKIMGSGQGIASYYHTAFGADHALWKETSPMRRLSNKAVPMLLVCSENRGEDSCAAAADFALQAGKAGASTELLPVALSHGEITIDLGLPSDYTGKVDAFIAKRLK